MTLKGKTKKTSSKRKRPLARPPKVVLQRVVHRRRRASTAVVVSLVVVGLACAIAAGAWFVRRDDDTKPGAMDVGTFTEKTGDAQTELGNISAELADLILSAKDGGDSAKSAIKAAPAIGDRAIAAADTFRATSVKPELSFTREFYASASTSFDISARILALGERAQDQALVTELANKAGRVMSFGQALTASASEARVAVENDETFVALQRDVATSKQVDRFPPGPPLSGIADGHAEPKVVVDRQIQNDKDYVAAATPILKTLHDSFATMGNVVGEYEKTGFSTPLAQAAVGWLDSAAKALVDLSAQRRPDMMQDADVALRNAMWLLNESARSFASVAGQPLLAPDLVRSGKQLRLLAEELWTTAQVAIQGSVGQSFQTPPLSGFDPLLINRSALPAQGSVPGGVPAPKTSGPGFPSGPQPQPQPGFPSGPQPQPQPGFPSGAQPQSGPAFPSG